VKHILPWLKKGTDRLHEHGKYLLTHTDGENKGLNSSYMQCGFDIADSVCPTPMTKLSLEEYREIYGTNITIWGGVPSVITLRSSFSDEGLVRDEGGDKVLDNRDNTGAF